MVSHLPKLAATTAGMALGMVLAQAAPAQAAAINYTFDILIDSGPLNAKTYTGKFGYDSKTLKLTDFDFTFEGTTYNKNDDPFASATTGSDGGFLGLDYSISTSPSFSFIPGFSDLSEAYFTYDLDLTDIGQGGVGAITFNRVISPDTESVPGPLPALGAAACFGYSRKLRNRMQSSRKPSASRTTD